MNDLSIIICTHNRAELLNTAIDSLFAAHYPPEKTIEIIVIANACSDNTHELLEKIAQSQQSNFLFRWDIEKQPGKSFALNKALNIINSPYVALIDDDHIVEHDFIINILETIKTQNNYSIFCGKIIPNWTGNEPSWVRETSHPYAVFPPPVPIYDLGNSSREITNNDELPGGGNLIVDSTIFSRVGFFSTDLGPRGHDLMGGEDTEFLLRALKKGERIFYEPKIQQRHFADPERLKFTYLLKKSFFRSKAIVQASQNNYSGIPNYMYNKIFRYAMHAIFTLNNVERRFYLLRLFAAAGEAAGFRAANNKQKLN